MEQILTSLTPFVRQLAVPAHNTITDGTLALALHCAVYIALEGCQRIDERAIEDGYGSE